jgi:hypothetical protein
LFPSAINGEKSNFNGNSLIRSPAFHRYYNPFVQSFIGWVTLMNLLNTGFLGCAVQLLRIHLLIKTVIFVLPQFISPLAISSVESQLDVP